VLDDEWPGGDHRGELGVAESFEKSEQVVVERFGGEIFARTEVAGEEDGMDASVEGCGEESEPRALTLSGENDVGCGFSLGE
jgi:hypothetical protein